MALNTIPLQDYKMPPEGPRCIAVPLSFNGAGTQLIDLQYQVANGALSMVQSLYVDNSANNFAALITISGINQPLIVPPQAQGYFPVLANNPAKLSVFTSSGIPVVVNIFLLNFIMPPAVWQAGGAPLLFDASGNLKVSESVLDALVISGALKTQGWGVTHNGTIIPIWQANQLASVNITAAGNTNIIAAQGAGVGWFLKEVQMRLSGNVTLGAAATISVLLTDNGVTIADAEVTIPAAAPANPPPNYEILTLRNLNYNSKTANVPLVCNLGTALATGRLTVSAAWGNTTIIGP